MRKLIPYTLFLSLLPGLALAETLTPTTLRADDTEVTVHLAGPEGADRALFITHDWFGVSPMYQELADRYAARGYRIMVVDLYGRPHATDGGGAQAMMNTYLGRPAAERAAELRLALESLARPGRTIVAMGFSMGGNVAFGVGSAEADLVDGTVVVYGGGMNQRADEELMAIDAPVLLITGSADGWAMGAMHPLMPRLLAGGKSVSFHVLADQPHAYMQPLFNAGAAYDAEATALTLELIDRFLASL